MKNNLKTKVSRVIMTWILVISMIVPMFSFALTTRATKTTVSDDQNYDAMTIQEIMKSNESLTWVFAGDSITHNSHFTMGMNGHSDWFEQYLKDIQSRQNDDVINSAWGGADIRDFLTVENTPDENGTDYDAGQGVENFITKYNPDVVFIKLGMNNRGMSRTNFVKYYKQMLNSVYEICENEYQKRPKVILLSPSPMSGENFYDDKGNSSPATSFVDSTLDLRDDIEALAEEYGLLFCDLRTAFLEEQVKLGDDYRHILFGDSSDGTVHPNAAGQYLIFKTLSKTLGIYDEENPIYQIAYDDFNSASLYVDDTYEVDYDNGYDGFSNEEMNKTMPALSASQGAELIASINFDEENGEGVFNGTDDYNTSTRVSLTDASVCDDVLTLKEVQNLGKEFSVVFRAKLNTTSGTYQPFLFLAEDNTSYADASLMLGVPGKASSGAYMSKNRENLTPERASALLKYGKTITGAWHTFAFVQSNEGFKVYMDGETIKTEYQQPKNTYLDNSTTTLKNEIGSYFTEAKDFVAYIGSCTAESGATAYNLDGTMDFYQFYNGALTGDDVVKLSAATEDDKEMDKTMPVVSTVAEEQPIASIDFNHSNGEFEGGATYADSTQVSLTDETVCSDVLTLGEVQNLGKEFSVVFRAKLNTTSGTYQPFLFLAEDNTSYADASLMLGVPGKASSGAYMSKNRENLTPERASALLKYGKTITGAWHTFAFVQSNEGFKVYMDGETIKTEYQQPKNTYLDNSTTTLENEIGSYFTEAKDFVAYIGSCTAENGATAYNLDGTMDFYQLYNYALTSTQISTLVGANAENEGAKTPELIASIDFDVTDGQFDATTDYATTTKVSLTDYRICDDALTLKEAKSLEKEFSIVFRAKLNASVGSYQTVCYISDASTANNWRTGLVVGVPGTKNTLFYANERYANLLPERTSGMLGMTGDKISGDGNWHTVAIVQSEEELAYYVDGQKAYSTGTTLANNIGSYCFANATDLVAYIGANASDTNDKNLDGLLDYYQLYDGALSQAQVQTLTAVNASTSTNVKTVSWSDAFAENSVWMMAGAEQMSGYEGTVVNRSLQRMIDNAIRFKEKYRDIRTVDAAAKGYTVEKLNNEYEEIIGENVHNVFLMLPEISQVYANNYEHSEEAVATYKQNVLELLEKEKDNVRILWTPLASNDATTNGYIDDYADAIREIAKKEDVHFFDANRFMNENMEANESLSRNWFEEEMYVSPLCMTDLVQAFFQVITKEVTSTWTGIAETVEHNLRYTSDIRVFKGEIIRDYLLPDEVTVNNEEITVDITNIKNKYSGLKSIVFAVMPDVGTGNYHKKIYTIPDNDVTNSENTYTFTAPCSNPLIAIYGEVEDGTIYRFKDFEVEVTASEDLTNQTSIPDGVYLDGLQVVGAPTFTLQENQFVYDVNLYQYQSSVQILATAQKGLEIQVNRQTIESGVNSPLFDVEDGTELTVVVSDKTNTHNDVVTYTLKLHRPDYPDIIVTEVMYDGYYTEENGGGDRYDLIEIYNASGKELNLLDYSIGYKADFTKSASAYAQDYPNYYFTGNNQALQGNSEVTQPTYTGINQITKYSTYWNDGSVTEPEEISFLADSTMVIWVLAAENASTKDQAKEFCEKLTYDTLVATMSNAENVDKYVRCVDGKAVVPTESQLVIAEIPATEETEKLRSIARNRAEDSTDYFYLGDHINVTVTQYQRTWLYILDDEASQAANGSITEKGNDIISAAKLGREAVLDKETNLVTYDAGKENLSSALAYNTDRGMSLAKGDASLTTFGAIEYWQKPLDLADTTTPTVNNKTSESVQRDSKAKIELELTDNEDLRYVELYVRTAGDDEFTCVATEDLVLKAGIENAGTSEDIKDYAYIYDLGALNNTAEYYGYVIDGNNNKTTFGTEAEPLTINVRRPGDLDIHMSSFAENGSEITEDFDGNITFEIEQGSANMDLAETYDIVDETKAKIGTVTLVDGKLVGTVAFKGGSKAFIKDLPVGAKYKVTVDLPYGYVAEQSIYTGEMSSEDAEVLDFIVYEKPCGDLKLQMEILDTNGSAVSNVTAKVKIVLTGDEVKGAYPIVDSKGNQLGVIEADSKVGTVSLKNGDVIYLKELPEASGYSVFVSAPDGYKDATDQTELVGSIVEGTQAEISVKLSAKTDDDTLGEDVSTTDGGSSTAGKNTDATGTPGTGDDGMPALWISLVTICLGACWFFKRRKFHS